MKAVLQRVYNASVEVEGDITGRIDNGLLLLVGFAPYDTEIMLKRVADKIISMRIFNDAEGKMNLSVADVKGALLLVSQFTLYADTRKGNRPSFIEAAPPEQAKELYLRFADILRNHSATLQIEQGIFGAHMNVTFTNSGPVTILLDSNSFR
jgi:D-tyrosyl-tRNA(Tyr) deacylase